MSEYLIKKTTLDGIAKAIQSKNLTNAKIDASDFKLKINQLPSLEVPKHPEIPYDEEKASEIAAVAQSYLDAIEDGRLVIVYESGYSVFHGTNQKLINDAGVYCIQCSAFVGLILRGIAYEDSPYYDGDGSKTSARTDLYSWANTYYELNQYINANQLAFYAFTTGCTLKSNHPDMIKKGDILFFAKDNGDYFAGIWHIAIALEDKGVKCVHALNGRVGAIWTFDMNNPPSNLGDLFYIARPQYNIDFSNLKDYITLKIIEQPSNYSGNAGETASFTVVAEGEGLTYKWEYSPNGSKWYASGFDGFDTATQLVVLSTNRNGQRYRCIITDKYGNTVTSEVVQLTVLS